MWRIRSSCQKHGRNPFLTWRLRGKSRRPLPADEPAAFADVLGAEVTLSLVVHEQDVIRVLPHEEIAWRSLAARCQNNGCTRYLDRACRSLVSAAREAFQRQDGHSHDAEHFRENMRKLHVCKNVRIVIIEKTESETPLRDHPPPLCVHFTRHTKDSIPI